MKKISFFILLIILLVFTSACSNSNTDSDVAETESEAITINQSLNFGDGLFQVTLEDASIQNNEMTMNVQVVNNSDKEEVVNSIMNMTVTQNGNNLNSESNPNYQENENDLNYTVNPGAAGDLTFNYALEDTSNSIEVKVIPGDGTGFNIPGESILTVDVNPQDGTVSAEEAKIEG